jgi:hypothetical protein
MNESVLQQALDDACKGSGLIFQPIVQNQILYLYINRPSGMAIEYEAIPARIYTIIASLELPDIKGIWLYCRILGETQPEWDHFLGFSSVSVQDPDIAEPKIAEQEEVIESFQVVLKDAELLIANSQDHLDTSATVTAVSTFVAPSTDNSWKGNIYDQGSEETKPTLFLKQYCFTRNRALLTSEVIPPSRAVAQLLCDFHGLAEIDKKGILPCLEDFFRSSPTAGMDQCSDDAATWFETLAQMPGHDLRKAAIWLSRYCYDPKNTFMTLQAILVH